MPVLMLVAAVIILAGVVVVASGRGGEIAPESPDYPPIDLGPVTAADVVMLRPPSAAWGYNMRVTDEALEAIARAVTERDVRISALEQEVSDLRGQAGGHQPGVQPAVPDPAFGQTSRADTAPAWLHEETAAGEPGPERPPYDAAAHGPEGAAYDPAAHGQPPHGTAGYPEATQEESPYPEATQEESPHPEATQEESSRPDVAHEESLSGAPAHEESSYLDAAHEEPPSGAPAHEEYPYPAPALEESPYETTSYADGGHEEPAYEAAAQGQPPHETVSYADAAHEDPAYPEAGQDLPWSTSQHLTWEAPAQPQEQARDDDADDRGSGPATDPDLPRVPADAADLSRPPSFWDTAAEPPAAPPAGSRVSGDEPDARWDERPHQTLVWGVAHQRAKATRIQEQDEADQEAARQDEDVQDGSDPAHYDEAWQTAGSEQDHE